MILRTVRCSICGNEYTEPKPNEGWQDWGALQGIILDGDENPMLCPTHLADVANYVDKLKQNCVSDIKDHEEETHS